MSDTPKAGLTWGMKQSFREYLEGISDLHIEAEGVTTVDAGYFFPLADSAGPTDLAFRGDLTIRAHRGMLRVVLRAPAIEALDSHPVLTADIGGRRVALCTLREQYSSSPAERVFDAELLDDGIPVFGDVYAAGTAMDSVVVALPQATPARV
jgi:hypothetical protein